MNWKHLLSRQVLKNGRRILGSTNSSYYRYAPTISIPNPPSSSLLTQNPKFPKPFSLSHRFIHSAQETVLNSTGSNEIQDDSGDSEEDDGNINDFLSRFVWIMRGKLSEVYGHCDKETIDGMLVIIVGKVLSEMEKGELEQMIGSAAATPSNDFSEDLWNTVWEVSNMVLEDMRSAEKKEKMKTFIQSEEVKEMCRFAGEVGIRGDILRELRFKWARDKMEESEFYEEFESLQKEESEQEELEKRKYEISSPEDVENDSVVVGKEKGMAISLPKRSGKIKYKIYGLDLSDRKWAEVADRIHETGEVIWPQEPQPISGECKMVTEKILSMEEEDDPSPLLAKWVELLQPSRIDWIALLDRLKERNVPLYLKVAELILGEESFQTNIRDYSKLIDTHAKENRLEDAERILKKTNEKGILPDILTFITMVHMYSKAGNLDRAQEAFENLKSQGFRPDTRVFNSMILAYVNAGQPLLGESLMREMESGNIKPTEEIYLALLRSFAACGDVSGALRIATAMEFAGFQPNLETCTLFVEAYGQASDPDNARKHFDHIIKLGHKPNDKCIASMIGAYEKKNLLDKGLNLLQQLEKDGIDSGVATYSVLVDWMCRLQLIDEAEALLGKIAEQGDSPSLDVHISLCDMYSRTGHEKKALQALGVLEAKKDQLKAEDFERTISALMAGGFVQDAQRVHGLMEAQGFAASEKVKVSLMASQTFNRKRPTLRYF